MLFFNLSVLSVYETGRCFIICCQNFRAGMRGFHLMAGINLMLFSGLTFTVADAA